MVLFVWLACFGLLGWFSLVWLVVLVWLVWFVLDGFVLVGWFGLVWLVWFGLVSFAWWVGLVGLVCVDLVAVSTLQEVVSDAAMDASQPPHEAFSIGNVHFPGFGDIRHRSPFFNDLHLML